MPPRPRSKALFISNLDAGYSQDEIKEYITSNLTTCQNVEVTKMASRNQEFYSSFHIVVPEDDFRDVSDLGLWPLGTVVRPFRGGLPEYRLYRPDEPPPDPLAPGGNT